MNISPVMASPILIQYFVLSVRNNLNSNTVSIHTSMELENGKPFSIFLFTRPPVTSFLASSNLQVLVS